MMRHLPGRSGTLGALATVAGALLAAPAATFAQCAMCGAAAASSPGVARGLAYSIFFLLGTLALVVCWLVLLVLRSQARVRRDPSLASAPGVLSIPPVPTGHAPAEK
jgi:hypothetical protein